VLDRAGLLYGEVLAAAAWAQFGREKGASTTEEREATRRRWLMTWPFIPGLLGKPPSSVVMVSQR
jgi:hypothetical protein